MLFRLGETCVTNSLTLNSLLVKLAGQLHRKFGTVTRETRCHICSEQYPFDLAIQLLLYIHVHNPHTIKYFGNCILLFSFHFIWLNFNELVRKQDDSAPFHDILILDWISLILSVTSTATHDHPQTPSTGLRHPSSTTAIFSYTIGSRKLSANEQFFVGAQTAVNLLQTTQIISDVCFIADHVAYTSSNKTKITWNQDNSFFFLPGVDVSHVYVHAWALGCFHSLISAQTFRRALTTSVDSCTEIKSAPSVA